MNSSPTWRRDIGSSSMRSSARLPTNHGFAMSTAHDIPSLAGVSSGIVSWPR